MFRVVERKDRGRIIVINDDNEEVAWAKRIDDYTIEIKGVDFELSRQDGNRAEFHKKVKESLLANGYMKVNTGEYGF